MAKCKNFSIYSQTSPPLANGVPLREMFDSRQIVVWRKTIFFDEFERYSSNRTFDNVAIYFPIDPWRIVWSVRRPLNRSRDENKTWDKRAETNVEKKRFEEIRNQCACCFVIYKIVRRRHRHFDMGSLHRHSGRIEKNRWDETINLLSFGYGISHC